MKVGPLKTRYFFYMAMGLFFMTMAAVLTSCSQENGNQKPNIILILADDISWDDFGCYGHPHIRTPHIDRLADEGIKFTNAFLTTASCSPSRASIITGRWPHCNGNAELSAGSDSETYPRFFEGVQFFPKLMKDAGYYTALCGKWHIGHNWIDPSGPAVDAFDTIYKGNPMLGGQEYWLKTLRKRPKDKPFFLWLAPHDAHRIFSATEGRHAIKNPHKADEVIVPPFLPDVPKMRRELAKYYDEVSRLDAYVGILMNELENQGVADNTLILFMADNGRPFPRCKPHLYDSGLKTPFIIRWPDRVAAGQISDSLISALDIAPTLISLAGLNPDETTFQGKSMLKLLDDPESSIQDHLFSEHNWHLYTAHERGVRTKDFLYIRNAYPELPGTGASTNGNKMIHKLNSEGKLNEIQQHLYLAPRPAEELYAVESDPHQLNNLAEDPAMVETMNRLRGLLDDWQRETGDTIPEDPTPDWCDRTTEKKTENWGKRGTPPGINLLKQD